MAKGFNSATAAKVRGNKTRILSMYADGITITNIGLDLGVSQQVVSYQLRSMTAQYEKRAPGQYVSRAAARKALDVLSASHDHGDSMAIQHLRGAHMRGASRDVLAVS